MTIKKFYESELTSLESQQALNNLFKEIEDEECETLAEALLMGFSWNKSNEGFAYWYKIFQEVLKHQKLKATS